MNRWIKGLAATVLALLVVSTVDAACKTDACKKAVAWKSGFAAVVLEDELDRKDYFALLDAIQRGGGKPAIEADGVVLAWIPTLAAPELRRATGVRDVLFQATEKSADLVSRGDARSALRFFAHVVNGQFDDQIEAGLTTVAAPLTGCTVGRTSWRDSENSQSLQDKPLTDRSGGSQKDTDVFTSPSGRSVRSVPLQITPNYWFRTPYQNPDMRGRVTVQMFRMDSDGTIDPNLYTWTSADLQKAHDQVFGAFVFWASQAANRGVALSFSVFTMDPYNRYARSFVPTPTGFEPITRKSYDDWAWINDALDRYGYGASPVTRENVYSQAEAFNRSRAADPTYGPFDRSFSVFVVYNPTNMGAPALFADSARAYAMWDGPFTTVMWDSGGWGPDNLDLVVTHETGHIFWACDEYWDANSSTGCTTCTHCNSQGPRNSITTPWITNGNCEYGSCDYPLTGCMMRRNTYELCSHTPAQLGW